MWCDWCPVFLFAFVFDGSVVVVVFVDVVGSSVELCELMKNGRAVVVFVVVIGVVVVVCGLCEWVGWDRDRRQVFVDCWSACLDL